MRPDRFQLLLLSAARSAPGVTAARTLAEAGHDRHPYGVEVEAAGRRTRWQVAAASRPGDDYAQPEGELVLGEKPSLIPAGPAGADVATVEAALIAAVLAADPGEVAAVERYSTRDTPAAVGHGGTFTMHDGAKVFLNLAR